MKMAYRSRLLATTLLMGAAAIASPAFAQTAPDTSAPAQDQPADESDQEVVVTGSRIARPNLTAPSPVAVVTGEQAVANADITLDTYLNTLPQVNPAGTTTSNNPGNNGQSNIDLRGLGSNRNLVLVNGRRPMVSGTDQTVDLNTIPQGLIDRIEVTTGGAGAAYGADAVAGVVNIIMKDNFSGVDLRVNYANSLPKTDAREYQISGTLGGNFADGRGNMAVSVEYSKRQGLIKSQRGFASQATSTTGTPPTGRYVASATNPFSAAAIASVFGSYGTAAKDLPPTGSQIGFNSDGTLFGTGLFNSTNDVANFRYPLTSAANPNLNFFPDFYSYNFDIINLLVLPLERKSAFLKGNYEVSKSFEFFVQGNYTDYTTSSALAPTPLGTVITGVGRNSPTQASTPLISSATNPATGRAYSVTGLVVPVTNPFISADFRTLLNSRTGDNPALTGVGAAEGINLAYRFLPTGLRQQDFRNRVYQGLFGLRGDISDSWKYEAYYSYGKTDINQTARGNVNVQKAQTLLEAPDGGASICAGGFNPFGIQPLSAECVAYVDEVGSTSTSFTQKVAQGYVTGELAQLPGGPLSIVLGAEQRKFKYAFDPGALFGPIAGFNTAVPAGGTNKFTDFFGELQVPIVKDAAWADEITLDLTARRSKSKFRDFVNGVDGQGSSDWAYGANLTWAIVPELRLRGSFQHTVRAPNFGELFSGGGGFPQIFDPCSVSTNLRKNGGAATAGTANGLCAAQLGAAAFPTFAATPGAQAFITTTGNTNLKPESSNTYTAGVVFNKWGFSGSVDYYNIKVKDVILQPDVNDIIASCFNYNGLNPTYSATSPYCTGLSRQGGNIAAIYLPQSLGGDPATGYFQSINQGSIKTSGIDVQLGYKLPTDFVAERSSLNFGLLLNYLIDYKVAGLPGIKNDYVGTASYFGAGLGTSFPRWRATGNIAFNIDAITLSTRIRYTDSMKNRASEQFPGESFTGPKSITYFDFAAETTVDALTFRIGVNNAFNKKPPQYAPNVQSGTDPSLYDVIGRRGYVSARLRF